MKEAQKRVKHLRSLGYSYRQIAQILKLPLSTVHRYANKEGESGSGRKKLIHTVNLIRNDREIRDKLVSLLLFTTEEKGTKRVLPYSKIFKEVELLLIAKGFKMKYHRFLHVLKAFIKAEFGSMENLEKLRRPKEAHKYRVSRGRVIREPEMMEIDATGYTYNGRQYSLLFAFDVETGYLFKPLIVENREKGAHWYNRAFTSYDVASYLTEIFSTYGIPKVLRCDKENVLNSSLIEKGLKKLGVKRPEIRPYNPNHKLIERAFKSFKEELRLHSALNPENNFREIVESTVESYNRNPHKFLHLQEPITPHEHFHGYSKKLPGEFIKGVWTETEERVMRNNLIQIEGKLFRMVTPIEHTRKKVLVEISLLDMNEVTVYDAATGELLGVARIEGKKIEKSTVELKKEKREKEKLLKKEKKLKEKLVQVASKKAEKVVSIENLIEEAEEIFTEPLSERSESQPSERLTLEDFEKLF